MTWIVRMPDSVVESDEFSLSDLIAIEKATKTPWSVLNPLRDISVAREFYRTALRLTGGDPADADTVTLKQLKTMFDHRDDEPWPGDAASEADDDAPLGRASSSGAQDGSSGPPKKRGGKQSATSS